MLASYLENYAGFLRDRASDGPYPSIASVNAEDAAGGAAAIRQSHQVMIDAKETGDEDPLLPGHPD